MSVRRRNIHSGRVGNPGSFDHELLNEAPVSLPAVEPLVDHAAALADPGIHVPGEHPTYGRGPWGVMCSEHWGDYRVNHGYYGAFEYRKEPVIINSDGEHIPVPDTDVLWSSDQNDGERAAILWQHRDDISAALRTVGYGGAEKVRIDAHVEDDQITVRNYDYSSDFEPIVVPRRS